MIIVVGGIQWGDEGKGKLVDLFGADADVCVRVQGGANSGHTLYVGDQKLIAHLIPSAVTYPQVTCLLGNDMVIDPLAFQKELAELQNLELFRCKQLGISRLAHLVMPYCLELEKLREKARGKGAIGTTGRGIGPTYEMRVRRLGIRVGDLLHLEKLHDYVNAILNELTPEISHWGGHVYSEEEVFAFLEQAREILAPFILAKPVSKIVCEADNKCQKVLIELAQGSGLDATHGTYPYVTSSTTIAGGACSGAGIGPNRIRQIYGITKAYCTRVGNGPFLTKIADPELADKVRKVGGEFGATTGRPRDVGWVDGPQLRQASRLNGLTGLIITKGDVLRGLKTKTCLYYKRNGRSFWHLDEIDPCEITEVEPVYDELAEFAEDISSCRYWLELPKQARKLFQQITDYAGVPLVAVSVGHKREQTIILQKPWQE